MIKSTENALMNYVIYSYIKDWHLWQLKGTQNDYRYVKGAPFVNKGYLVFRQTKMILKRVTGVKLRGRTSP